MGILIGFVLLMLVLAGVNAFQRIEKLEERMDEFENRPARREYDRIRREGLKEEKK